MAQIPPLSGKGCEAWDALVLDGKRMPGLVEVKPKKGYKVDKQPGLGEDGGSTTVQGREIPDVRVTLTTVTKQDVQDLAALLAVIFPSGNTAPHAFAASHPALAMIGITNLFFETIEGPTRVDKTRLTVSFGCFATAPPKPAAGTGGTGTYQPGVPANRMLLELRDQAIRDADAARAAGSASINKVTTISESNTRMADAIANKWRNGGRGGS